jgi:hypothetical protein
MGRDCNTEGASAPGRITGVAGTAFLSRPAGQRRGLGAGSSRSGAPKYGTP